jgi:hypothetical protein
MRIDIPQAALCWPSLKPVPDAEKMLFESVVERSS